MAVKLFFSTFYTFRTFFCTPRCRLKQYELWKIFDLQCGRSYFVDLYPLNGWLPIWYALIQVTDFVEN